MTYFQSDDFMIWSFSIMIGVVLILWILKFVSRSKPKKMIKIRSNEKGFTLIELLIVMTIIGVLAAIAIPQFSSYRVRAFDADAMLALHTATLAQEAYYTDYQTYALTGSSQEINDISSDITIVITHSIDQYHMFAKHDNSPHWFEVHGPGGSIEASH